MSQKRKESGLSFYPELSLAMAR